MSYNPWIPTPRSVPPTKNPGGRPRTSLDPNGTTAKGYDGEHRRLRKLAAAQVASGFCRCCLCGRHIRPGTPWHLAHADRPDAHQKHLYAGPAHARCNNATNRRRQSRPKKAKALAFFDTAIPKPSVQLTVL
jgi:hypothetical protein